MRFLKGSAALCLSFLATCAFTERTFPLPQVAEKDKRMSLSIGEISLFMDPEFRDPLKKDHPLAKRAESAKQEARATFRGTLEGQGFVCHEPCEGSGIQLLVDIGLRMNFFRFFLVARVRGSSEEDGREILCILMETEVFNGDDEEVRRAGRELAKKLAEGLKEVLARP